MSFLYTTLAVMLVAALLWGGKPDNWLSVTPERIGAGIVLPMAFLDQSSGGGVMVAAMLGFFALAVWSQRWWPAAAVVTTGFALAFRFTPEWFNQLLGVRLFLEVGHATWLALAVIMGTVLRRLSWSERAQ